MSGAPSLTDMRIKGPRPFVTLRSYTDRDRKILWRARHNRKGLSPQDRGQETDQPPFWRTRSYNWHTGLFFAIGSLLFMLGATLSMPPDTQVTSPPAWLIGVVFFMGSIPFTIAGYLQHFQAANAPEFNVDPDAATTPRRISFVGWHPRSPGWLSTFAQFLGTIAFNLNTLDAIHPVTGWYFQDLTIWVPGMIGSVLFLVSGYLAFIETCHGYFAWRPRDLDWWIVFVNLLGCIFFMTAGILAYIPRGPEPGWIPLLANAHLWLGAFGFLTGAGLMMRESSNSAAGKYDRFQ